MLSPAPLISLEFWVTQGPTSPLLFNKQGSRFLVHKTQAPRIPILSQELRSLQDAHPHSARQPRPSYGVSPVSLSPTACAVMLSSTACMVTGR